MDICHQLHNKMLVDSKPKPPLLHHQTQYNVKITLVHKLELNLDYTVSLGKYCQTSSMKFE